MHRALLDYTPLLSSMIRNHAQLKRPLSLKFVSDSQAKEVEDVFEKLLAMEKEEQEEKDALLK